MKRTSQAVAATDLILEVFRVNGQLLYAGDILGKPMGLTSARWQVLGAVELAGRPLTVSQIARRMGISRQAVQRVANDLKKLDFVVFKDNPDHARAKLILPSGKGWDALNRIDERQIKWSNELSRGLSVAQLKNALEVLTKLRARCETPEVAMTRRAGAGISKNR